MALLPARQRDQVMVLITIAAIGLVGLFWYYVYDPRNTELDTLAAHVDTLDQRNQQAKSELAKGTAEQVREEARASRENLDLMRTLVPAANEVPNLIDQVSSAARRAGHDVGALEPEPVIEGELFDTYRYRMGINGSYHDIGRMFSNIGSLNRIVTALNVQLVLPTGALVSPPGKQLLATSFEIQTYVIRTSPRAKPAAPTPPGGAPPPAGDAAGATPLGGGRGGAARGAKPPEG
ncbi:MAG: type 4a pilus biogenesis protein PilO, partial [Gemmatimonadales bacterium]